MLNELFMKNKKEDFSKILDICNELHMNVQEYVDNDKPLLKGKVESYSKFVNDKNLPETEQNVSESLKEFAKLFQRAVIWENPGAMINITPPSNIISSASAFYASLYNPNFAQDESSGYLMATELLVSKYLAQLTGWNHEQSKGIFTFGGKGTNLYAVKTGLMKCFPDIIEEGLANRKAVVISNEKGHPCHKEICDWLGLGKKSCLRLPVNEKGQLDITVLEKALRENIENNIKIACIILNGGTTNEILVDPIKAAVDLRDNLVKEYNLDYIPHIHVDAVIGWAWVFFKNYNFLKNELCMSDIEVKKIKSLNKKINEIEYADSYGADFHKTGFCPYISSIYMTKNYKDLLSLGNKQTKDLNNMTFGEYSPFEFTLELTRSAIGPVSAFMALETFGVSGFQKMIYNVFSTSEYIRNKISKRVGFEVINLDTEGIATLFVITKDKLKYSEILKASKKELADFLDYNHQFYLYTLKLLEEGKINFKMTFSKSYKPYGSDEPTGALKIYPTSPLTTTEEIDAILEQLFNAKEAFDKEHLNLKDERDLPVDFVYRQ